MDEGDPDAARQVCSWVILAFEGDILRFGLE